MTSATDLPTAITQSAERVRAALGTRRPRVAVILGSGWGAVADAVADAVAGAVPGADPSPVALPYAELPAFPTLGIGGHAGVLRAGRIGGCEVLVLAGRKHAYETGAADGMKGAIRTLAALGIDTLVQTNAAGSCDPAMPPGALMAISDHLNLSQRSPLFGEPDDRRFVDMSAAYDPALRALAHEAAASIGQPLHEGVYAWFVGPQFETPAEVRMARLLGAHAVGMSTVPETILARHAGLRVLAFSLITNLAAGISDVPLSHAHTLATAKAGEAAALALMRVVLERLP